MADALASLAAALALGAAERMMIPVCSCWVVPPDDEHINMICVLEIDTEDLHQPIIEYL